MEVVLKFNELQKFEVDPKATCIDNVKHWKIRGTEVVQNLGSAIIS